MLVQLQLWGLCSLHHIVTLVTQSDPQHRIMNHKCGLLQSCVIQVPLSFLKRLLD